MPKYKRICICVWNEKTFASTPLWQLRFRNRAKAIIIRNKKLHGALFVEKLSHAKYNA